MAQFFNIDLSEWVKLINRYKQMRAKRKRSYSFLCPLSVFKGGTFVFQVWTEAFDFVKKK